MDFDALASTYMSSTPRRPAAVTLTFDLQNLIRSPIGASEFPASFIDTAQALHEILW